MTKLSHRIATLVLAGLFLVTSVGFSLLIIWQMHQEGQKDKSSQNSNNETKTTEGNKLQGTKLTGFQPLTTKVDKLQIVDLSDGSGAVASKDSTITAHYTGALVKDGVIFQSSHDTDQPFTSPLTGLIKGWQDGIPGMKEGGKRRLIIPAADAYGVQAQDGIPANSDLVFDIELQKVAK